VVVDWTVALFFRRDIVELSMLGHPRSLRASPESAIADSGRAEDP
jgi:hypothetical protein